MHAQPSATHLELVHEPLAVQAAELADAGVPQADHPAQPALAPAVEVAVALHGAEQVAQVAGGPYRLLCVE